MSALSATAAEEQAEELEGILAFFGEHCQVDCDDPGHIAFALQIAADLGAGEGQSVRVQAKVPVEEDNEEQQVTSSGQGTNSSASIAETASAVERAEQMIQQRAQIAVAPALQRSQSGKHMTCPEAVVKHLPPLTLQVSLPAEYPSEPPCFHLACIWLTSEQLAHLCNLMDTLTEQMLGMPIIIAWAELLREEIATLIEAEGGIVTLAVSETAPDIRAVAECIDPMSAMMEVLQYDNGREMEVWRLEMQQCGICFSDKPGSQFVHLGGCMHAFCRECVTEMANLHVTEGTILELRCPQPDCRAEISPNSLEEVLNDEGYERWHGLKLQQIMTSELEGLVFCPRCEEMGCDTPVLSERPASEEDAPIAVCGKCAYVFCGRCLGVAHSKIAECISAEERAVQVAMRRDQGKAPCLADRRKRQRALKGKIFEIVVGQPSPKVDAIGLVVEELGPMQVGDEIMSVSSGTKDADLKLLWSKSEHDIGALEGSLNMSPPLVVRFRTPQTTNQQERERKRRAMEELMSLRAIHADSQCCPKCHVRITRSQGCNHMNCTHCGTHFCYRCGATLNAASPYSHFSESTCPTFDRGEVQRIVNEQRRGGDQELAELRQQFGNQQELYEQFAERQVVRRRPVVGGDGRRRANDTACPTCGHWNGRQGRLNHVRCPVCRTSYCHHCGRRIVGVVTNHYRGEGACPQHSG